MGSFTGFARDRIEKRPSRLALTRRLLSGRVASLPHPQRAERPDNRQLKLAPNHLRFRGRLLRPMLRRQILVGLHLMQT